MAERGPAIVVLRPGVVWGPGSPCVLGPETDLLRGAAFLAGSGDGICNLMYVDDLLRGIDAVVAHREAPSGFYHVGDNETITWAEYYGALAAGLGVDPETIRAVPRDRYRPGLRDRVDELKALPLYKRARAGLPGEARGQIKRRLARGRGRERPIASAGGNTV